MNAPPYTVKRCDALLVPSGPGLHLHVVVSDPCQAKQVALLCISTIRPSKYDQTCVVKAGEHPFVTADSYVVYRNARVTDAAHLEHCVNKGDWPLRTPASLPLVQRMCAGIAASKFTPRYVIDYCWANNIG